MVAAVATAELGGGTGGCRARSEAGGGRPVGRRRFRWRRDANDGAEAASGAGGGGGVRVPSSRPHHAMTHASATNATPNAIVISAGRARLGSMSSNDFWKSVTSPAKT